MTVFALPNISFLVLGYVEWLEQRRGRKRQAADDNSFQPVSCATVSNYLNSLVSIVKFQLRHDLQLRDPLLDQLRNLRSQAESYTVTQKRFEKVHPEWCSWQQLQLAREKCRAAFDQLADDARGRRTCSIYASCVCCVCSPSVLRHAAPSSGCWSGTRHWCRSERGWALGDRPDGPVPCGVTPQDAQAQGSSATAATIDARSVPDKAARWSHDGGPVFPARASTTAFMSPTGFTNFVKTTFGKYTEGGKAPNPSLLRSIFTTWLYGLRYDTEDAFLAQIKASSAQWKAHSEQIAATVYNKQLVYQQREFAVLLKFCEAYSGRFAYDGASQSNGDGGGVGLVGGGADVRTRPTSPVGNGGRHA